MIRNTQTILFLLSISLGSVQCSYPLRLYKYGLHREGLYHSGIVHCGQQGPHSFDKLFLVRNSVLPESLFVKRMDRDGSPWYSFQFENLLESFQDGDEDYLAFYRLFIAPGDENVPCVSTLYGVFRIEGGELLSGQSLISLNDCEIPHNYWLPAKVTQEGECILFHVDTSVSTGLRTIPVFRIEGPVDSQFTIGEYLKHREEYKEHANEGKWKMSMTRRARTREESE